MGTDQLSTQIGRLFAKEDWKKARTLLEKELARTPDSHWLLDRISVTYYEQKQYEKALAWIERAFSIKSDCPLVLWDYAGTLFALEMNDEALGLYTRIINSYPDGLLRDECGEDPNWVSSLVMDCFFRIAMCMKKLNRPHDASWFLENFIRMRIKHPKLESLYSVEAAEKQLSSLEVKGERALIHETKLASEYLAECV
jgi:tetratricopeptide (TPR) repeat protein